MAVIRSTGLTLQQTAFLASLTFVFLFGQFLNKPVHIDDANFLTLARGAAADIRRPHLISINWMGETELAFDVLSNPPGIAWWLLPVLNQPLWVQHLWMMLWLVPTAWGTVQLGRAFCGNDGWAAVWILLTCPVVVLSAQSLLPDLPLLACTVLGLGGYVSGRGSRFGWAWITGCAGLFRYSGCLAIPVLLLLGWRRAGWRGVWGCWPALLPLSLLMVHDFAVYGRWHLLAMFAFQNDGQHKSLEIAIHNLVAAGCMLGGAGLLPVLVWGRSVIPALLIGMWVGVNAAWLSEQTVHQAIPTVFFAGCGAVVLSLVIERRSRDPVLSLWAMLGIVLFGISRFAATRYWVPFLPAFVLLGLRFRGDRRSVSLAIAANLLLSTGLAIDDYEFACSQRDAALMVADRAAQGQFTGHWGWQHYLEAQGWSPIERDHSPKDWLARTVVADPQTVAGGARLRTMATFVVEDTWPGPRSHSMTARAAYHGGGKGSYSPWSFSSEPYDTVRLQRVTSSGRETGR